MSQAGTQTAADPATIAAGNPGSGTQDASKINGTQLHPSGPDPRDIKIKEYEARLGSNQAFWNKAKGYGLEKPEDLETWGPAIKHLIGKKIDPRHLATAFDDPQQEQPQPLTAQGLQELLDKREQEQAIRAAQREYEKALNSDLDALAPEKLGGMFKNAPKGWSELAADAAMGRYLRSRSDYEPDHPLHGKAQRPLGQEGLANLQKYLQDTYAELSKHFKAQHLADVGDAARTQTNGTVAGPNTGGGAPAKQERGAPTKEEAMAKLQMIRAQRAGRTS